MKKTPSSVEALLDRNIVESIVEEKTKRLHLRPETPPLQPRGLRLRQAATYSGVTPREFRLLVQNGLMPPPTFRNGGRSSGRPVWDRYAIDAAFDDLSGLNQETTGKSPEEWLELLGQPNG